MARDTEMIEGGRGWVGARDSLSVKFCFSSFFLFYQILLFADTELFSFFDAENPFSTFFDITDLFPMQMICLQCKQFPFDSIHLFLKYAIHFCHTMAKSPVLNTNDFFLDIT